MYHISATIIAAFVILAFAGLSAQNASAAVSQGADSAPQLQLVGTVQGGQPTALPNHEVSFYGKSFCAAPVCSPVTLTIGDHIVADGIQVEPDGSFAGRFRVAEPPGLYTVRATQNSGSNKIEDVKSLLVPLGEAH
jgi:hypothetical protein